MRCGQYVKGISYMARMIVAGLINIETTLKIDGFPIDYRPVRFPFFGVNSSVSGVGYNLSKSLTVLGNDIDFLTMIGNDAAGTLVRQSLAADNIPAKHVLNHLKHTPQSVILYDPDGKRMINTDLKDIQDTPYPLVHLDFTNCDLAVLCNINFARPMLVRAQQAGVPIATDVHTIADLDDDYNRDYMAAADILFMSDEHLPTSPEDWVRQLQARYNTPIIGIGLGSEGALLAVREDNFMARFPAKALRPIVNTIGAGDALFSAFVHTYAQTKNPYVAIQKAILFAGYKIGATGAADGFMTATELDLVYKKHQA